MNPLSAVRSVAGNRCPRCLQGRVFKTDNPYRLRHFTEMHGVCSHCGLDFRQEPGFYFGAAYVSYGLQVAFMLLLYLLLQVIFEFDFWVFVSLLAGLLLLLIPVFFRVSRLIWLNLVGRKD